MIQKYVITFFLLLSAICVKAQTAAQAQVLFNKGEYDKALAAYQKLSKSQPANATYALYYGACLEKTGNPQAAIKPLELALKRRVVAANMYLAEAYNKLYLFEDAVDSQESYIEDLEKKKKSTEEAQQQLEVYEHNLSMIKAVERITVVDSVVIDKADFLNAYRISQDVGRLYRNMDFFGKGVSQTTVYQNELGNMILYSEKQKNGKENILIAEKNGDKWDEGRLLPANVNGKSNAAYPFQSSDGMTLYFSSDNEDSMGGYDIFVTRSGSEAGSYLKPENLGMPFNSPYNDYMYVVDESTGIGWFASDRFQPAGKVCIYSFIPNATRDVVDYDNTDPKELANLAMLNSIQLTQKDKSIVAKAHQSLIEPNQTDVSGNKNLPSFVIDDNRTYHQATDFKSKKARGFYEAYISTKAQYDTKSSELEAQRSRYATAAANVRSQMKASLLKLEQEVMSLEANCQKLAKQARNAEIKP